MDIFNSQGSQLRLVVHNHGHSAVVDIAGELDAHGAPELEELGHSLISDGVSELVLDMSHTTFVDSSALRAMLTVRDSTVRSGGTFFVANPTDTVRRLLSITGLDEELSIRVTKHDS